MENGDKLEVREKESQKIEVRDNIDDKNIEKTPVLTYGFSGKGYNKTKKNKLPFIIMAIAIIVIVGTVIFLIKYMSSKEQDKPDITTEKPTNSSAIDLTETPYNSPTPIPFIEPDVSLDVYATLKDGDHVEIKEYVIDASLSPNINHCVYLTSNNKLYYVKTDNTKVKEISSNCRSIEIITNVGIIYSDMNDNAHRYLFDKNSDITLGPLNECCFADSNLNAAWTKFWENQNIYRLKESSDEIEIISTYEYSCYVSDISEDGESVYWDVYDMNGDTSVSVGASSTVKGSTTSGASGLLSISERVPKEYIYEYKNGKISIKVDLDNRSSWDYEPIGCNTLLNGSDSFAYVYNDYMYELNIINESGNIITYKLENPISNYICTKNGRFENDKSLRYEGIYVNVLEEKPNRRVVNNISYLNPYGKRFDLLSDVLDYVIFEEYIYYINNEGKLLKSKLLGYKLGEPEVIDDGVHEILGDLCTNGYVYYSKRTHEAYENKKREGELWVYSEKLGTKKASDEVFFDMNDTRYWDHENVSVDGKTVYFFKNVRYTSETKDEIIGDLYRYTYGDDQANWIDLGVVLGSVKGGSNMTRIEDNSCVYHRYINYPNGGPKSEWICYDYQDYDPDYHEDQDPSSIVKSVSIRILSKFGTKKIFIRNAKNN